MRASRSRRGTRRGESRVTARTRVIAGASGVGAAGTADDGSRSSTTAEARSAFLRDEINRPTAADACRASLAPRTAGDDCTREATADGIVNLTDATHTCAAR